MHFTKSATLAILATSVHAISLPSFPSFPSLQPRATCPAIWKTITTDLSAIFVSGLVCTDDARAAIRAVFHDCFPQGGCDGSLSIASELARPENTPMTSYVNKAKALAVKRGVGVADLLMFAGCK